MTKNPLSFLFAGFRYLLHCFSAGRLFDRCRFGRLSRRIFLGNSGRRCSGSVAHVFCASGNCLSSAA